MRKKGIPSLRYMSIVDHDLGDMRYCTTIAKLEYDLKKMLQDGYRSLSMQECIRAYRGEDEFDIDKVFSVVFVGGYLNNYGLAFPVLKKLNIKASMFIATDLIGVTEYPAVPNFTPHFGWQEAQEMIDSGLVKIYPQWHRFDHGKDFREEILKKVSLFENELCGNGEILAFSGDDYGLLKALNGLGIRSCITEYSICDKEHLENGAIPAITVDYHEDVLDTVSLFHTFYTDVMEKIDSVSQENVTYEDPPEEVLQTSVILPIESDPIIRNYLHHAFPISVLQANRRDRAERFVLNEYIDLIYKPGYDWLDYHNDAYTHWECIESRGITKEILDTNCVRVVAYIINGLKVGYYSDIWLDTYYIPGKPGYNERHVTHGLLIYGYDAGKREFAVLSYADNGQYKKLNVPIKAISLGCSNRNFTLLTLIRDNASVTIPYDIRSLCEKLNNYIHSICYDDNTRYNKKTTEQYVQYEACLKFAKDIEQNTKVKGYIPTTAMYSYAEHKRCMGWRLNYIAVREGIESSRFKEYEQFSKEKTEQLLNLALKYNMTGNLNNIDRVVTLMNELNQREYEAIVALTEVIEEKVFAAFH